MKNYLNKQFSLKNNLSLLNSRLQKLQVGQNCPSSVSAVTVKDSTVIIHYEFYFPLATDYEVVEKALELTELKEIMMMNDVLAGKITPYKAHCQLALGKDSACGYFDLSKLTDFDDRHSIGLFFTHGIGYENRFAKEPQRIAQDDITNAIATLCHDLQNPQMKSLCAF